jgi:hypothetical protein
MGEVMKTVLMVQELFAKILHHGQAKNLNWNLEKTKLLFSSPIGSGRPHLIAEVMGVGANEPSSSVHFAPSGWQIYLIDYSAFQIKLFWSI